MVTLKAVQESNAALSSSMSDQVAVFVGATSGIALQTLTEYARRSLRPTAYIVGRNSTKLASIIADLEALNPAGRFKPLEGEISLLKNVDAVCAAFGAQESHLDLLVMAPGYLKVTRQDNADGLEDTISLRYYVRMRFLQQLLPVLSAAQPAARVVNIHGAGKEGRMDEDDLELRRSFSLRSSGIHTCTMNTLAMTELAPGYPTVSFIHAFPGVVLTGGFDRLAEHWPALLRVLFLRLAVPLVRPFTVPLEECGERHLFLATSARYPPKVVGGVEEDGDGKGDGKEGKALAGVPMPAGVEVAQGADGSPGSGCYMLGVDGEPVGDRALLDDYRARGMGKTVWAHTQTVFDRVLANSV
ncbi:MAG: hypothetical protein M1826_007028 [Phylliscum demangeonii]|nr:MAG: hypothetical protein M1826_007028 [Phylliscum demangeonii]